MASREKSKGRGGALCPDRDTASEKFDGCPSLTMMKARARSTAERCATALRKQTGDMLGACAPAGRTGGIPTHAKHMNLNLGSIQIPLNAATKTFAILAKRGAGKSYTAAVLAEEFFTQNIPFVVF